MKQQKIKIGVVSITTPPSPSGQAIVLSELLSINNRFDFYLYNTGSYDLDQVNDPHRTNKCHNAIIGNFSHGSGGTQPRKRYSWIQPISIILDLVDIISKAKKLEKEFDSSKIDIAIACSGEITDLPAACKASRKLGIPLIHYAFDDYVNREIGIRRVWARAIERIYMKYVERTIVTNEFEEMDYRERGYTNTMIVRNPSPVEKIIECSRNLKKVGNDPFQIIYTGSIYSAHYDSFKRLILAMELAESDWNLHIYTSISPEILAENGIVGSRVKILPYVRRVEAILAMIRSDALFLPLAFESQYPEVIRSSSPGKIGDYLSSGTPVLVHAPSDSYVAKLFIDNNCGIVIDVPDAIAISKALHKLASDLRNNEVLSRNSRMTATNEFAREVNFERFAKAIELAFDS